MAEQLVLAVDIGTGSVRAIAFNPAGWILAEAREALQTQHPATGWSEQEPDAVLQATCRVIANGLAQAASVGVVTALIFSSQMYSVLAIDRAGRPLTGSIPWSDSRAEAAATELRMGVASRGLPAITGCPVQAIYPLAKIRWLRASLSLPADVRFISIKDYVLWRLSGHLVADWSTASATGLLDISSRKWSEQAMAAAGVGIDNLPPLASPVSVLPRSRRDMLFELGLAKGVQVLLGAGDAPLSSVGCGAVSARTLAVNIGTSGAARRMIPRPATDPLGHLWTYVLDGEHWVTGGIVGSAGATLDWIVDITGSGADLLNHIDDVAASVAPGAEGLTFLPYFTGEQSPAWRPGTRGAFVGLGLHHDRRHLVRAGLEGLAFALQRVRLAIEARGDPELTEVAVTGGVCRSVVVRQVLADVLGLEVISPPGHEGSARGAAALAWVATRVIPDLETFAERTLADAPRIVPSIEAHRTYRSLYRKFAAIADSLATTTLETAP